MLTALALNSPTSALCYVTAVPAAQMWSNLNFAAAAAQWGFTFSSYYVVVTVGIAGAGCYLLLAWLISLGPVGWASGAPTPGVPLHVAAALLLVTSPTRRYSALSLGWLIALSLGGWWVSLISPSRLSWSWDLIEVALAWRHLSWLGNAHGWGSMPSTPALLSAAVPSRAIRATIARTAHHPLKLRVVRHTFGAGELPLSGGGAPIKDVTTLVSYLALGGATCILHGARHSTGVVTAGAAVTATRVHRVGWPHVRAAAAALGLAWASAGVTKVTAVVGVLEL